MRWKNFDNVPADKSGVTITTAFLLFLMCVAIFVLPAGAANISQTATLTQTTAPATTTIATTTSTTQTTSSVTTSATTTTSTTQTTIPSTTTTTTATTTAASAGVNPIVMFNADPKYGNAPLEVQFNDMTTGGPISWNWDFGDGGSDTIQNPIHTYTDAGIYTVLLTATSRTGSGIKTQVDYIEVEPAPTTTATTTVTTAASETGLLGSFTGSPRSGSAPLTVVFTDTSAGTPIAWQWNFGDEASDTSQNPVHTYSEEGTYTVTLKVNSSSIGKTVKQVDYITVSPATDSVTPERTLYGSVGNDYPERTTRVTTVASSDRNSVQSGTGKTKTPTPTLTGKAWLEYEKQRMAELDNLSSAQQNKDIISQIVDFFKGLFSLGK